MEERQLADAQRKIGELALDNDILQRADLTDRRQCRQTLRVDSRGSWRDPVPYSAPSLRRLPGRVLRHTLWRVAQTFRLRAIGAPVGVP